MITGFNLFHPLANLIYFLGVLLLTMMLMDPLALVILLIGQISYGFIISGHKKVFQSFRFSFPIGILMVIINPLINHRGRIILFELFGKSITFEAVLMGAMMAISLIVIITMFVSYEEIVDYHKFIFIVGRVLPKTAFLTTMTIRYIPLLKRRYEIISFTRRMIVVTEGNLMSRIKSVNQKILMLLGWSVESAITTSDSMTARGYGLVERSRYQSYTWQVRDSLYVTVSVVLLSILVFFRIEGRLYMQVYPDMVVATRDMIDYLLYGGLFAFVNIPLWIEWKEQYRWHYSGSKN
ncbi:MAG: energy-coupling factor transporter transmembrane component T [Vallitaleaceae bacterium]|jgi:energy-coupling factor transport system permease protein|nr:energy-coupling factor transporter transmembrane component T [Vallitaleaceae bacterium]